MKGVLADRQVADHPPVAMRRDVAGRPPCAPGPTRPALLGGADSMRPTEPVDGFERADIEEEQPFIRYFDAFDVDHADAQQARLLSGQDGDNSGQVVTTDSAVAIYGFRSVAVNICTASTSFWSTVLTRLNSWRVSCAEMRSAAVGSELRRPLRGLCRRSGAARRSFMLSRVAISVPQACDTGVITIALGSQRPRRLKNRVDVSMASAM